MFKFSIASVDTIFFDDEIYSATVPAASGEVTILAHHVPLITTLKDGVIKVRTEQGRDLQEFKISGGLLEMSGNRGTVLV